MSTDPFWNADGTPNFDAIRAAGLFGPGRRPAAPELIADDPSPCIECRHFERCKAHLHACEAFSVWVRFGRNSASAPRQPSVEIFARVFREPRAGDRRFSNA